MVLDRLRGWRLIQLGDRSLPTMLKKKQYAVKQRRGSRAIGIARVLSRSNKISMLLKLGGRWEYICRQSGPTAKNISENGISQLIHKTWFLNSLEIFQVLISFSPRPAARRVSMPPWVFRDSGQISAARSAAVPDIPFNGQF